MGQLGKVRAGGVFRCAVWSLGLMLSAAAARSAVFFFFFFNPPSTGALEMIHNGRFTFLNLILIDWACLAEIVKRS